MEGQCDNIGKPLAGTGAGEGRSLFCFVYHDDPDFQGEEKAYPIDEFPAWDCWQVCDFLKKLCTPTLLMTMSKFKTMYLAPQNICQKLLFDALKDWEIGKRQVIAQYPRPSYKSMESGDYIRNRKWLHNHLAPEVGGLIDEYLLLNLEIPDTVEASQTWIQTYGPQIDELAFESYLERFVRKGDMDSVFGPNSRVIYLSEHALCSIFHDREGWNRFQEAHPESCGIVFVNCPAFSASGEKAMMSIGQQRGPLDGIGATYLFELRGTIGLR